jgi:hypothetical protein
MLPFLYGYVNLLWVEGFGAFSIPAAHGEKHLHRPNDVPYKKSSFRRNGRIFCLFQKSQAALHQASIQKNGLIVARNPVKNILEDRPHFLV